MLVAPPVNSSAKTEKSKSELFPKCVRTKQVTYPFSNLKSSQSVLDYHELRRLQAISEGPGHREAAHRIFMSQYSAVLKPPAIRASKSRGTPFRTESLENQLAANELVPTSAAPVSSVLPRAQPTARRRTRKTATPFQNDIHTLRRLLRKIHVQRSPAEHQEIFEILQKFPDFMNLDPRKELLRQIAEITHLELCDEIKQPVLPSAGFFLVLKGSVIWQSANAEVPISSEGATSEKLTVGESFGTVKPSTDGKSKSHWYITNEENCEFLKIDKDEFATVKTKFEQVEYQERYSLIRSCGDYKLWAKQTTDEIVRLIEWLDYPANTILASEGFRCPFIAFLKTGECHILRKVDVLKTAQNGTKNRQIRQVVMGKISSPYSFGEISVLSQEAMTCTIVTASACRLGIIRPDKSAALPEVTRKLLIHTAQRTYAHLSQDDIRREYVSQETRKEWADFKKDIVHDVMFRKDIRTGQGKWQHAHRTPSANRLSKSSMH